MSKSVYSRARHHLKSASKKYFQKSASNKSWKRYKRLQNGIFNVIKR